MTYSVEDSGAFVHTFELEPTGSGALTGLTFAVKDLMDVAGQKTGFGNPRWHETHSPAAAHAICLEQLLAAGAKCIGRTITDELAYSLIGENHFYGSPLNPNAPDRVTGGSSCGSASAVACGIVDFALGTDTGGSVRIPASNCGIWGIRPTHGLIPVAGVRSLAPSFDTVGVLASTADVLCKAASVLLSTSPVDPGRPTVVHVIQEALEAADPSFSEAVHRSIQSLKNILGDCISRTSIREIDGATDVRDLSNWYEIYRVLQRAEAWSELGGWIEAEQPELGSMIRESLELAKSVDRSLIPMILERRENLCRKILSFMGPRDLLLMPTSSAIAPKRGTIHRRDGEKGYYFKTLSLTSIAGVARMPQISMPLTKVDGVPAGVSLLARPHEDAFLLGIVKEITAEATKKPE